MLAVATATSALAVDPQHFSQIERGRYLTIVSDCAACHTAAGGEAFAGGRPIETPFGNVVATNITPDRETGIGAWSDEAFVRAMTEGVRADGTRLYPAMPYGYFTKMPRDDVLAIRAFLNTIPLAKHAVEANQLSFPFNLRFGLAVWDKLFFTAGPYQPALSKDAEWNRGAYLVQGPMHCGACHTPKNLAGADKHDSLLRGNAMQGWFAPDISNANRRGLGSWSLDDIVAYLRTGHNRFTAASGPMAEEVSHASSRMHAEDLHAIAVYLKDQRADEAATTPVAEADPAMKIGAAIYADECSACHAPRGTGVPGMFPALSGSPAAQSTDATSLIRMVLVGGRSVATEEAPTGPAMPSFGRLLSDREAAAVLTFVRNSWGTRHRRSCRMRWRNVGRTWPNDTVDHGGDMRTRNLLVAMLALPPLPVAAYADPQSLSGFVPITIEDAFPTPHAKRELQGVGYWTHGPDRKDLVTLIPQFKMGAFPRTQIELAPSYSLGSAAGRDQGTVTFGGLYNFNDQGDYLPAFAVHDDYSQGLGLHGGVSSNSLRLVATKSLGDPGHAPRLHLNLTWNRTIDATPLQRADRYEATIGYSQLLGEHTAFVADYVHSQNLGHGSPQLIEAGIRHEVSQVLAVALAPASDSGRARPTIAC